MRIETFANGQRLDDLGGGQAPGPAPDPAEATRPGPAAQDKAALVDDFDAMATAAGAPPGPADPAVGVRTARANVLDDVTGADQVKAQAASAAVDEGVKTAPAPSPDPVGADVGATDDMDAFAAVDPVTGAPSSPHPDALGIGIDDIVGTPDIDTDRDRDDDLDRRDDDLDGPPGMGDSGH